MNGYSEVPHNGSHNGEINNYLRKDLDTKATAKNTACWNLLGKVRTERTLCFSLYTALELCGVELPRHSTLPQKDFYVTVKSKGGPLFIEQYRLSHMECKVQQYHLFKRRNLHASHGCVDTVCPISQPHRISGTGRSTHQTLWIRH